MERDRFLALYAAVFFTLITTISTVLSNHLIIAGIAGISSTLIYREAVKAANKKGLNRVTKVLLPLQRNILFLGLIGLTGLLSTVPQYLAISSLFSFSLLILTQLEVKNKLNRTYKLSFGHIEIGLAAAATLLLSGLNPYFGFYGSILIIMLSLYQEVELLTRALNLRS